MKILHVLYSGLGGHGNVFFSMVSADKNHEFQYEVLFNGVEDIRYEYIAKCESHAIQWNFIKKKKGVHLTYFKALWQIIKASDSEIIFLHSSAYILPAILGKFFSHKKKRIIIRETQANNLKGKKDWLWLSLSFLVANKIVFLSEEYNTEIKKKIKWLYNKKKISVIPNGIDLTVFSPSEKIKKSYLNIGMQSRLTPNKDHPTLLKAFALLKTIDEPNVTLKIAGDGICRHDLEKLCRQLKIEDSVEFTGMLMEDDLVNFLQNLDIYVHASFGETMSTALMQAMACGLPIIASDVPGINNMITNNKTGILVPVKNEKELSIAIKNLVNTSDFASEIGKNAYNFSALNYSNTRMFNRYKQLFTL